MCHFCLSKCYQNMQPAHSLCSYQVAGFCLRYQKADFGCSSTHLHTPDYLLPVSDHNLSYFFHVKHLVMISAWDVGSTAGKFQPMNFWGMCPGCWPASLDSIRIILFAGMFWKGNF